MKMLVVDDHPVMRLGMRQLLGRRWPDAHVSEAQSIAEALEALAGGGADLILSDLGLPDAVGVDGIARLLRAARGAPVLVLSQNPEATYGTRLLQMGARGFVPKDRAGDELVVAVERVLAGGRYISPASSEQLLVQLDEGRPALPHEGLSAQELRVLQLIAAGRSPAQIAQVMNLSVKTLGSYRARLMLKGGWDSTAEMSKYCLQHGLADPA
jgi:two-component system invasion response regulator UvrY